MEPILKSKASFAGGINYAVEPYKLGEAEIPYLSNGRARYNSVETIRKPLRDVTGIPLAAEKWQGLYSAGRYALAFVDGRAYYKDYDVAGAAWQQIPSFQMSALADRIFAALVPSSSANLLRKAGSSAGEPVTLTTTLGGTPQCVVCQDGLSQPWVINFDLTARQLNNYEQWTTVNQEYVPVGKQMAYSGVVLYTVSADGKKLYRSVSGRPLNYMVVIDANGDKLATEADGGAEVVSHGVDFETITCLGAANTPEGDLFVSTLRNSNFVRPNFTSTLFGEPTFSNIALFNTGAVNQQSFTQLLGDSAFIDIAGIRSFNAVLQSKFESKNNPFAAKIYPWFQGVLQTATAATLHDDYAFFSVNTIFGRAVLVYDTLRQAWESIDFWSFATAEEYPTQFAEIKTSSGERHLLAMTESGIYRCFAGQELETTQLYVGDWTAAPMRAEQQPELLNLLFSETRQTGTVFASIFVDGRLSLELTNPVNATAGAVELPITPPFGVGDEDLTQELAFDIGRAQQGTKVGVLIRWAFSAALDQVDYRAGLYTARVTLKEATAKEAGYRAGVPEVLAFTPTEGVTGTIITLVGEHLDTVEQVLVGSQLATILEQSPTQLKFTIPNAATTNKIELRNSSVTVFSDSELVVG